MPPIIGITADLNDTRHRVGSRYSQAIEQAGGIPLILPPILGLEAHFLRICDGFVFTGGNDPIMEQWGIATHPMAEPVQQDRQNFEVSLLEALQHEPAIPVLGVCFGMQLMGIIAGGTLNQHLEEPAASFHADGNHLIEGSIGSGDVHSHHHQAMLDAGTMDVIAQSKDGLIEAISDPSRKWYVGVQWHPERTEHNELGQGLFSTLVSESNVRIPLS